jgi:SAM-dependent methyltransferase
MAAFVPGGKSTRRNTTADDNDDSDTENDASPNWALLSEQLSPAALAALQSHLHGGPPQPQSQPTPPSTTANNAGAAAAASSSAAAAAPHNGVFKEKGYWEQRFAIEDEYDWLLTFAHMERQLVPLLHPDDRILIVGCGNSTLSADLYDHGYHHITNIDYSPTVIEKMAAMHGTERPGMAWLEQDMTDLRFDTGSFDVVLDKASMDALMVSEGDVWAPNEDTVHATDRMCHGVSRVLKDATGRFVQISFAQPHFRTKYLMATHLLPPDQRQQQVGSVYNPVRGHCDRYRWSLEYEPIVTEAGCLESFLYVMRKD